MALIVLDSWAVLAFLKDEPAAGRIEAEWASAGAAICSINLGEVLYVRIRVQGEQSAEADIDAVRRRLNVVEPDWQLTVAAAKVEALGGLAYADAFGIATAAQLGAPLWTGDPEILDGAAGQACEFVDLRS